jgi:putative transcriptional regulator
MNLKIPEQIPAPGRILLSQPTLIGNFFSQSVIYIAEYNSEGCLGICLNRISPYVMHEILEGTWKNQLMVYSGGPVQTEILSFLHSKGDLIPNSHEVADGIFMGGDLEIARELLTAGLISKKEIRFFMGYAGWGEGQLEAEIEEKSWIVLEGLRKYIFTERPQLLWRFLLAGLGKEYALWVNYPRNPDLN